MHIDEIRGVSLIRENYPPAIVINSKDRLNEFRDRNILQEIDLPDLQKENY